MARIPDQTALADTKISASRPMATFSPSEIAAVGSPGRALSNLGESIAGIGVSFEKEQERNDNYEVERRLIQFNERQERSFDEEQHSNMPEGGEGYSTQWRAKEESAGREAFQDGQSVIKSPGALHRLDKGLLQGVERRHSRASEQEIRERERFHNQQVGTDLQGLTARAIEKPDAVQDRLDEGERLIDSSRIPQRQKDALKQRFYSDTVSQAELSRAARGDPDMALDRLRQLPTSMTPKAPVTGQTPMSGEHVVPEDVPPAGLLIPGDIDPRDRKVFKDADGKIVTMNSMVFEIDGGRAIVVPGIDDKGKKLTPEQAMKQATDSGKNLGIFDSRENAEYYAKSLSAQQDRLYSDNPKPRAPQGQQRSAVDADIDADVDGQGGGGGGVRNPSRIAAAQQGQAVAPMQVARTYLGKSEGRDAEVLAAFFRKSGGQKLNPADTAWCAAFVNAALGETGRPGTGTLAARDFLKVGTPTKNPQVGDIVVFSRGNSSWQGHVGFYAGKDEDGNILVLGGNQSNRVSIAPYSASRVLGFRQPPEAGDASLPRFAGTGATASSRQTMTDASADGGEDEGGGEGDWDTTVSPESGAAGSGQWTFTDNPAYPRLKMQDRLNVIRKIQEGQRVVVNRQMEDSIAAISAGETPQVDQQGRSALDRARQVMTPMQYARWEEKWNTAVQTRAALAPLTNLSTADSIELLSRLPPNVRTRAERAHARIEELREKDPVRAIAGGNLQGADRAPRIITDGNGMPVVTQDEATDLRLQPVPEVAAVYREMRANKGLQVGISPTTGNIEMRSQDPAVMQAAWSRLFDARLAAQRRLGVFDQNQRILAQAEAKALLKMPAEAAIADQDEWEKMVREADQRAKAMYGPTYGPRAVREALRFRAGMNADRQAYIQDTYPATKQGPAVTRPTQNPAKQEGQFITPPKEAPRAEAPAAPKKEAKVWPLPSPQDAQVLNRGRNNPKLISRFEGLYGPGSAWRTIQELEKRLGASDR